MSDTILNISILAIAIGFFLLGGANGRYNLTDKLERQCLIENKITLNDTEFECHIELNPND